LVEILNEIGEDWVEIPERMVFEVLSFSVLQEKINFPAVYKVVGTGVIAVPALFVVAKTE
jgi:hypothetical protein